MAPGAGGQEGGARLPLVTRLGHMGREDDHTLDQILPKRKCWPFKLAGGPNVDRALRRDGRHWLDSETKCMTQSGPGNRLRGFRAARPGRVPPRGLEIYDAWD